MESFRSFERNAAVLVSALAVLVALLTGCSQELVPEAYLPSHAHESYARSLARANLSHTALGQAWIAASTRVLQEPREITTPFREAFYIDPGEAFAAGILFEVAMGQRVEIEAEIESRKSLRLFLDLFRFDSPSRRLGDHVASSAAGEARLEFEPRQDAHYVLRLQPELLSGGRVVLTIRRVAALGFPVAEADTDAIQSLFGDPREGGRRRHHGVDIFSRRHTPVLAPTRAWVSYVGKRGIGGNVVWLRDRQRSFSLYFAHLQTHDVEAGRWVEAGEQIGTVGNSGNARTTPPHLHFGIYARGRGPIDPFPYLKRPEGAPPEISVDPSILGGWARVAEVSALRSRPSRRAPILLELPAKTAVFVEAASGSRYRVSLPDGSSGYVNGKDLERLATPLQARRLDGDTPLLDQPADAALEMARLPAGKEVAVMAGFGEFLLVESPEGKTGWMSD